MNLYRVTKTYITNEQRNIINKCCFNNKCTKIRLLNDCNDY